MDKITVAKNLYYKGYDMTEIADMIGVADSSAIRALLDEDSKGDEKNAED